MQFEGQVKILFIQGFDYNETFRHKLQSVSTDVNFKVCSLNLDSFMESILKFCMNLGTEIYDISPVTSFS
jgi:hypothetical protein